MIRDEERLSWDIIIAGVLAFLAPIMLAAFCLPDVPLY